MKKHDLYPITVQLVRNHPQVLKEIFIESKPHDGVYIGVSLLEGCFMWESVGEMYDSLFFGERFALYRDPDADPRFNSALKVQRNDGTLIGTLPFQVSLFPNILIDRGINVYCYLEAKAFNAGIPEVAVSIYCDKY